MVPFGIIMSRIYTSYSQALSLRVIMHTEATGTNSKYVNIFRYNNNITLLAPLRVKYIYAGLICIVLKTTRL